MACTYFVIIFQICVNVTESNIRVTEFVVPFYIHFFSRIQYHVGGSHETMLIKKRALYTWKHWESAGIERDSF